MEISNYNSKQKEIILNEFMGKYEMEDLKDGDYRFKVPFRFKGYDFSIAIRVCECKGSNSLFGFVEDYNTAYPHSDLNRYAYAKILSMLSGWDMVYCKILAKELSELCWNKHLEVYKEVKDVFTRCFSIYHPKDSYLEDHYS